MTHLILHLRCQFLLPLFFELVGLEMRSEILLEFGQENWGYPIRKNNNNVSQAAAEQSRRVEKTK